MKRSRRLPPKQGPVVGIEGDFYVWHSLAHVNRELAYHLSAHFDVRVLAYDPPDVDRTCYPHGQELSLLEHSQLTPDILIRHAFPPNGAPTSSKLVVMQPWEYFAVPDLWMALCSKRAVALWSNSSFTRNIYIANGIDPAQASRLPLGYDPSIFFPNHKPHQHDRSFRFLFVGGFIERKGVDLLLEAFCREFSRREDVTLVVNDTGINHVYKNSPLRDILEERLSSTFAPRIEHIAEDLSPEALGDLYRACDCLVQPYRAEGFCLPALEAMACGLPVIVTHGGPTDDFVQEGCGWKVASIRVPIGQLPGLESALPQGWFEPDLRDLRLAMRAAYEDAAITREMGRVAAKAVARFTWKEVASQYAEAIRRIESRADAKHRPRISLCMIVRNEERVLDACLTSARPWFDEIVIVDTGSDDRTLEIARSHGARVFEMKWPDSFAEARNVSLKHAQGEWIFWMDADDTLPRGSGESIRRAAASAPSDVVGYVVPVQFVDDVQGAGTRVDHVKLFRNLPDVRFEGRIHEQVLPSLRETGGKIARSDAVVLHSGYDTSDLGQQRKRERDRHLLALDLKERPDHPFVLFNLGMTAHFTGEHGEAIEWLGKCLAVSRPSESHVRKAYAMLGCSLRELKQVQEAIQTWLRGLDAVGEDPELRFHLGMSYSSLNEFSESRRHYEAVLGAQTESYFSSVDIGILGFKTLHNLGATCLSMGDYGAARSYWLRAIESSPEFLPSVFELFRAGIGEGDFNTCESMLGLVCSKQGRSSSWLEMCQELDRARSGNAVESGMDGEMSLARRLLHEERVEEAIPILESLAERGIAEAAFYLGVHHIRRADYKGALEWMTRASVLNPGHLQSKEQVEKLMTIVGQSGGDG